MTRYRLAPLDATYDKVPAKHLPGTIVAATDATEDIGPQMQAMYDNQGVHHFKLADGTGSYLLDTPLFWDATVQGADHRVTLDLNGAKLILGPSLPSSDQFTPDTARKWAIFPNLLRAAWNLGTNKVSVIAANAALGPFVIVPEMFQILNGTVDGLKANVSLCFGMNATMRADIKASGLFNVTSWRGYCDKGGGTIVVDDILSAAEYAASGATEKQCMVRQVDFGDGAIWSLEGHGRAYAAIVKNSHPAIFPGNISGNIKAQQSRILVPGAHIECEQFADGLRAGPAIHVDNSAVHIDATEFFTGHGNNDYPTIEVNDAAGDGHSELIVRDSAFICFYRSGALKYSDAQTSQPDIRITAANLNTVVRVENCWTEVITATTVTHRRVGAPLVTSSDSTLQALLDTFRAKAIMATGSYEIRRTSSTGWTISPLHTSGFLFVAKMSQPNAFALSATPDIGGGTEGTLSTGSPYQYCAAMRDAQGNYGLRSSASAAISPTSGALRVAVAHASGVAGVMVIWRKQSNDGTVVASPTHYIEMLVNCRVPWFIDTGDHLQKLPWLTASVPIPNTVAGTDHTVEGILTPSGTLIT